MNEAQFKSRFLLKPLQRNVIKQAACYRSAAVLIGLVNRDSQLHLIMTRRALHLRHHPGQISFPGGGFDRSDINLKHTALRETYEEIGISAEKINIIGQMGQYLTLSNYVVTPFIGFVDPNYLMSIDANEVEEAFEVPWRFFAERQNHVALSIPRGGHSHLVHFMPFDQKMIWGTTAAIIHDLVLHFE